MSNLGRKLQRWTRDEIARLHALYSQRKTRTEIAAALGVEESRVRQRLQWEASIGTIRIRQRKAEVLLGPNENLAPSEFVELSPGPRPTPEALAMRDLRLQLAPRDLTAAFFGDPLPGFSALEMRS